MNRYLLTILLVLFGSSAAVAYQNDVVSIQEKAKDPSPTAAFLAREMAVAIEDKLSEEFPCLKISTLSERIHAVNWLREQQLIGPGGSVEKSNQATSEEEAAFQAEIEKKLTALAPDHKYLILVMTTGSPLINIRISAYNREQKKGGFFFQENKMFASQEEAVAATKSIAGELTKALATKASKNEWHNEVCPFKGKVEVEVQTKRRKEDKNRSLVWCNGGEWNYSKVKTDTVERKELWTLDRYGNPETSGTAEVSETHIVVTDELDGCHECKPGKRGEWRSTDVVLSTGSASGLDTSTVNMQTGKSDHKDATVRLRFREDGTFKLRVWAVTKPGKARTTHTTTIKGVCGSEVKAPEPQETVFTRPLEYEFGPFNGTVFDKWLSYKRTYKLPNNDLDEETEMTIYFDLKRPKNQFK